MVVVATCPQTAIGAPIIGDEQRPRHDGASDEFAQRFGRAVRGDGEANVSGTRRARLGAGALPATLEAYRHPELAQGLDGCGNVAPIISREWRRSRAVGSRGQRRPAGVIDAMQEDWSQQSVFDPVREEQPRPDEKSQLHDGVEAHAPGLRVDLAARR